MLVAGLDHKVQLEKIHMYHISTCVPNKDTDLPVYLCSLIRLMPWTLHYTESAQERLWCNCVDMQVDLSLQWAHVQKYVQFHRSAKTANPCPAEPGYTLPLQPVQIQISWLLKKPTDLDLHCLSLNIWICMNNLDQVIWLAENWKCHFNLLSMTRVNNGTGLLSHLS